MIQYLDWRTNVALVVHQQHHLSLVPDHRELSRAFRAQPIAVVRESVDEALSISACHAVKPTKGIEAASSILSFPGFIATASSLIAIRSFGGLVPAGLFKRIAIAVIANRAEKKEPVALDALAALFRRGYFVEMPEHPQTIGYALTDTPVGMAAWMLDHDADSYKKISQAFLDGRPAGGLTRDRIVDNMTLYWLTNTATSSARLYWENFRIIFAAIASGEKSPELSLPVSFTVFPDEIFQAPRSWAEEVYPNLIYFNEADKGGHFAAWEVPEVFASELRTAFRSLR